MFVLKIQIDSSFDSNSLPDSWGDYLIYKSVFSSPSANVAEEFLKTNGHKNQYLTIHGCV